MRMLIQNSGQCLWFTSFIYPLLQRVKFNSSKVTSTAHVFFGIVMKFMHYKETFIYEFKKMFDEST